MNRKTMLIPDISWIDIPAGPFLYGDGQTRRTLELQAFRIAKYPVTNRQYQCFIDARGYEDQRWWEDLIKPEPKASRWPHANRPKTDVNWYEAMAFCRWLAEMEGFEVGLPTESQWEKAARGERGSVYPWGNEYRSGYANIDETYSKAGASYLQQTIAVGLYPHAKSPYDVEDCSGNVWEWCLNKYSSPELTPPDASNDPRVLRGGSWVSTTSGARSDYRGGLDPDGRDYDAGFRVVSLRPIR